MLIFTFCTLFKVVTDKFATKVMVLSPVFVAFTVLALLCVAVTAGITTEITRTAALNIVIIIENNKTIPVFRVAVINVNYIPSYFGSLLDCSISSSTSSTRPLSTTMSKVSYASFQDTLSSSLL